MAGRWIVLCGRRDQEDEGITQTIAPCRVAETNFPCVYICMLLLRSAHCLKLLQSFAPLIAFQANSYQVVAIAIMTQLAPKLLINIRREYYQMRLAERTDLSWMINNADNL